MKAALLVFILLTGYWLGYNHATEAHQEYLHNAAVILEGKP